ncbi:MAG: hypothetical protein ABEK59_03430 [Halobacteria archaeon]
MESKKLSVILVVSLLAVTGSASVVSADSWSLDPKNPTVDTPTRTVTLEGQDFDVSGIIKVSKGEDIKAGLQAPDDEEYEATLRKGNDERTIVDFDRGSGSGTIELTSDYDPGPYSIVVNPTQGKFSAIYPVVVEGYSVSMDAPSSVNQSDEPEIQVDVTPTSSSGSPHQVKAIIGDETHETSAIATENSDGSYTAKVDTSGLPEGNYLVYAVAQNDVVVDGKNQVLGLSDSSNIQVTSSNEDDGNEEEEEQQQEQQQEEELPLPGKPVEENTTENTTGEERKETNETGELPGQNGTEEQQPPETRNGTVTEENHSSETGEELGENSRSGSDESDKKNSEPVQPNLDENQSDRGSNLSENENSQGQPLDAHYLIIAVSGIAALAYRLRR